MPTYIYESHLGGIYFADEELDFNELYCEQCCDSDWLIGEAKTAKEAIAVLSNEIAIDDCGGYSLNFILERIAWHFGENINPEEAIEIIKKNKEYFGEDGDDNNA